MIARDDGYNPTNTVKVTKQLVLQDKVFAMLGGLGTPTHTKVVDFLNASRVPDLFVSSGCLCWDQPDRTTRRRSAGSPTTRSRARSSASTSRRTSRARRSPTSCRTTTSAPTGPRASTSTSPRATSSTRQTYEPGNTDIGPQMAKIKASGAEVVAMFTIPAYTALVTLAGLKLDYHPQLVVSNVGSDPTTLKGLLKAFSKGKAGEPLIDGIAADAYLPPVGDTSNNWIALFQQIHDQYIPKLPFDGNVELRDGAGLHVRRGAGQGAARTRRARASSTRSRGGGLTGPGLVPFRFSKDSHAGYTGAQIGDDQERRDRADGQAADHRRRRRGHHRVGGSPAPAPANGIPPG